MNIRPAFVADFQAAKLVQPGQGALDDPAMAAQFLAAVDAAPCDPGQDAMLLQPEPVGAAVIAFIGVQLRRTPAGSPGRTFGTVVARRSVEPFSSTVSTRRAFPGVTETLRQISVRPVLMSLTERLKSVLASSPGKGGRVS